MIWNNRIFMLRRFWRFSWRFWWRFLLLFSWFRRWRTWWRARRLFRFRFLHFLLFFFLPLLLLKFLLSLFLLSLLNPSQFFLKLNILLSAQFSQFINLLFLFSHISVQVVHLLIKLQALLSHLLNLFLLVSVFLLHFLMFWRTTFFINFFCLFPLWLFFLKSHFLKAKFFLLLQNFNSVYVNLNIVLFGNFGQSINFIQNMFLQNSIIFSHFHGFLDFVINRMDLLHNYLIFLCQTWELCSCIIFLSSVQVQHVFHSFVRSFLLIFKSFTLSPQQG